MNAAKKWFKIYSTVTMGNQGHFYLLFDNFPKIKIKKFGFFNLSIFKNKLDGLEHYALSKGKFINKKSVRVRVISVKIDKSIEKLKNTQADIFFFLSTRM